MQRKMRYWVTVAVICLLAAGVWYWGKQRQPAPTHAGLWLPPHDPLPELGPRNYAQSTPLLSPTVLGITNGSSTAATKTNVVSHNIPLLAYRLTNTTESLTNLMRSDSALLLRNALIDTAVGQEVAIPPHLKSDGDPGSYIVQARGAIGKDFHDQLAAAGAKLISYIPNNAFLVQASDAVATQIRGFPITQAVLPWEPYYKLDLPLLEKAVKQEPLPPRETLTVLLFPGERDSGLEALRGMGAKIMSEDRSPFGRAVVIEPPSDSLPQLAKLPEVQSIELHRRRQLANDIARVRAAVSTNTLKTSQNYLGLSGSNVIVGIVDTGVQETHPDLLGRVFGVTNDVSGHGTHVAGTIASSGLNGPDGSKIPGSVKDATYRGIAFAAKLFSLPIDLITGPLISDEYLQQTLAQTNVNVANNSWGYPLPNYNLAAASYDAAVRDTVPEQTGPRPMTFIFAAGNSGNGSVDGDADNGDQIWSPASAKNVLAIGGMENMRRITNEVVVNGQTNASFYPETDSEEQVAFFSSRGNVGIGLEGDFGRFKPDLVAPGAWMVSCRATNWQDPTNAISASSFRITEEFIAPKGTNLYPFVNLPNNVTEMTIRILSNQRSPKPMPHLLIHASPNDPPAFIPPTLKGADSVTFPVTPGTWWVGLLNTNFVGVNYDMQVIIWRTNDFGTYFTELKKLNDLAGPLYRFESGTSMAAPVVSGTAALMEQFFKEKLNITNSPAMLKALLINGARSLDCSQCPAQYDLQVRKSINHQGWGLVNLTNSIPIALNTNPQNPQSWPILMYDQDPARALTTGDSQTFDIELSTRARFEPLRVTLVWTDPPGNPVASLKLVNDLDLIVSNKVDGRVYIGNNIGQGAHFNSALFPGESNAPPYDLVNNVENVFISAEQTLSSRYSVTVRARRVNVNAVTTQTNGILQDFALVIASGNSRLTNVFLPSSFNSPIVANDPTPSVQSLTNKQALLNQRVGANTPFFTVDTNNTPGPSHGVLNQWNFYVFDNTNSSFTNIAIFTFLPPELSVARFKEADIDLYVSFDPSLTNLNRAVINAAPPVTYKSLTRGGTEMIIFTNESRTPFYVGVKSEDQQAASFGIFAIAQARPFGGRDENGNIPLEFFTTGNGEIPDGTPDNPGGVRFFSIMPDPGTIRRVVITNDVFHEEGGDLTGNLSLNNAFSVLNSGRVFSGPQRFVYDDSGEEDMPWSIVSDGPGSLRDFSGQTAAGLWQFTMIDNDRGHTGYVARVFGLIEPQNDTNETGVLLSVAAHKWRYTTVEVPVGVTNFIVSLTQEAGTLLPLDLYLRRLNRPTVTDFDKMKTINPPGGSLELGRYDFPSLQSGRYEVGISNPNNSSVTFRLRYDFQYDLSPLATAVYYASNSMPLIDDAKVSSTITVTNARMISDLKVGVRIDHPRIADLALRLVSPQGTRILLAENRGGMLATNYGGGTQTVYSVSQTITGNAAEFRTNIYTLERSGIVRISYDFFQLADSIRIYYDGRRIFDSGVVNGANTLNVPFGPGLSTNVTIVVNEGGNLLSGTEWTFSATVTGPWKYAVFTDKPTLGDPVKFGFPPFFREPTNVVAFSNSFENAEARIHSTNDVPPFPLDGWKVRSNYVAVITDTNVAQHGSNYLALSHGAVSIPLTNIFADRDYMLSFAQRKVSSSPTQTVVLTVTNKADLYGTLGTNALVAPAVRGVAVPKLRLCPGQEVQILTTTNDLINFGSGPYGPEGNTNILDAFNNPSYALMGCWSSHPTRLDYFTAASRPFYIGTNISVSAPNEPGDYYLFLGANDPNGSWGDNTGFWTVDVRWQHCQLASGQYQLGSTPLRFDGSPKTNWQSENIRFVGNPTTTNLLLRPELNTTLLFDSFLIQEIVPSAIYQSEEPMIAALQSEFAIGDWQLEVWDTRAGPAGVGTNAAGTLLSWSLNFVFADGPGTIPLTNGVPFRASVRGDQVMYFQVAVPREVREARNSLTGKPDVELLYNPFGLPEGNSPPDPIPPNNIPNPLVLSNTAPPNLGIELPVGRIYYLAVRNTDPSAGTNNFTIRVDFDIPITPLLNRLTVGPIDLPPSPYTFQQEQSYPSLEITNHMQYFRFDIPNTNFISAVLRLSPLANAQGQSSSNLNLVLRRALPVVDLFPHRTLYDYESTEAVDIPEVIIVNSNSIPVKLSPGRWYAGVYNSGTNTARYRIGVDYEDFPQFSFTNIVIPVGKDGIIISNVVGQSSRTLNSFFRFVSDQTNAAVLFELFGLDTDLDLLVRRSDLPNPDLYEFGFLSIGPLLNAIPPNPGYEPIPLRTNIFIPHLNATNFFLQVINRGTNGRAEGLLCVKVFPKVNPIIGCEFNAFITPPVAPGGPISICFDTVNGTTYTVEKSTDLINWTIVAGPSVGPGGLYCPTLTAPPGPLEFYRIRAE